jgi:hypothetical protein
MPDASWLMSACRELHECFCVPMRDLLDGVSVCLLGIKAKSLRPAPGRDGGKGDLARDEVHGAGFEAGGDGLAEAQAQLLRRKPRDEGHDRKAAIDDHPQERPLRR